MRGITAPFVSIVWTVFFASSRFHHVAATTASPAFLPQGFLFDWNPAGTTIPIPVTQQCETLHITWQRGSTSVGQNPTAPYYLQIFTSTYVVPFLIPAGSGTSFDYQVPFSPGTQYQICMWDSQGVSGGCQDIYTVIPNSSATTQNPATCANVTFPHPPLQVSAAVSGGAFSQYGWVPQCTDIQFQPKNGTGPYTLTVAPTLHPPLNITSSGGSINWTVSLSHGFPFFISVSDSQGNSWAQGPLHSGDNGNTACLNIEHSPDGGSSSSVAPATIGAGAGGILVGIFAGAFGILAFRRWRRSRRRNRHWENTPARDSLLSSDSPRNPRGMMANRGSGREYIVEPFNVPSALDSPSPSDPGVPLSSGGNPTSALGSGDAADQSGRRPNVYVVHHDGGRAPVTVYTEEGAAVVELPPQYAAGSTGTRSESDGSREVDRRREPGATPRKSRDRETRPP